MLCEFEVKCECSQMVLYKLVAGISDNELLKKLLTKAELTLVEAEKSAATAEIAKYSQEAIASDSNSTIISTFKKQQNGEGPKSCRACGSSKPHKDRKTGCPAWS